MTCKGTVICRVHGAYESLTVLMNIGIIHPVACNLILELASKLLLLFDLVFGDRFLFLMDLQVCTS